MNYQLVKNNDWKEVEINEEKENIPHHWGIEKISNLVKTGVTKGTTPSTIGFEFIKSGDIKFFKIEHMKNDILLDSDIFINEECNKKMKRSQLMENDILFSIAGTIGNIAVVEKKHLPANTNQAVAIIRLKNHEDVNFIKFYFKIYINKLTKNALKGVISNFNLGMLENLNIRVPSIKEKNIISELLSKQESIISNIEKLIEKNEIIFKELSEQLLLGELRLKEEDGKVSIYKNSEDNWKVVEVNGEMKEFPKDWEVIHFEKLGELFSGKRQKYTPTEIEKENNKIYFSVGGEHVGKNKFNLKNEFYVNEDFFNKQKKGQIVVNDLLIIKDGATTGKNMFVFEKPHANMLLNEHVYRFVSKNNDPYYVFSLFNGEVVQDILQTKISGMIPSLNQENFSQIETIYTPDLEEQNLIANFLLSKEKSIEKQKKLLFKEKQKFDWLLDNLLSGNYLVKEK